MSAFETISARIVKSRTKTKSEKKVFRVGERVDRIQRWVHLRLIVDIKKYDKLREKINKTWWRQIEGTTKKNEKK